MVSIPTGRKVRVLKNDVGAYSMTHTVELAPGDIIFFEEVDEEEGLGFYRDFLGDTNVIPLNYVELVSTVCTCDVMELILGECRCGVV